MTGVDISMNLGIFLQKLGHSYSYYPNLAKALGGVNACIFYCQLLQWYSELKNSQDWIKVSSDKIEKQTGLSRAEQEMARRILVERGLLQERFVNNSIETREFLLELDNFEKILDNISEDSNSHNSTAELENHYRRREIKTDKYFPQRRQPIAIAVTPDYRFSGPWKNEEELKEFQRALEEYAKNNGLGFGNPSGWAFKVIDSISKGLPSSFWDDFVAGIPLGESQKIKREWEIEPGVPYPAFEEERIQYYIQKGEPIEAAVAKARADLRNPILGKDLWDGFLRKCNRLADEALKAKNLGINAPYLPPSFTDKPAITKESVMKKLAAINSQSFLATTANLASLKTQEKEKEKNNSDNRSEIPSLAALQAAYKTPMGKTLVEKQIASHPEWGYQIIDGQIVESIPF